MRHKTAKGIVETWHSDLGWGVLTSPDVGAEIWAHFSAIEATGYRELHPGDAVEFGYHRADQDGFEYVADSIRRR